MIQVVKKISAILSLSFILISCGGKSLTEPQNKTYNLLSGTWAAEDIATKDSSGTYHSISPGASISSLGSMIGITFAFSKETLEMTITSQSELKVKGSIEYLENSFNYTITKENRQSFFFEVTDNKLYLRASDESEFLVLRKI